MHSGLTMAVGYTDWQQGAAEGLKIGFKMGQAYEQAQKGINVSGFDRQTSTTTGLESTLEKIPCSSCRS